MKEIFIERNQKLLRTAIRECGRLKECYVEEEDDTPKVGEIYKGTVKTIVASMKSAFIDIGYTKNCYMNLKDSAVTLKKGDEVLVEILKEEIDKKGPRVTNKISLPGTYVVLTNGNNYLSISPKISNKDFKASIKEKLVKPDDIGVVIRTKSEMVDVELLNNEIQWLYKNYLDIVKRFRYSSKLGKLHSDEGSLSRILRNYLGGENVKITFNSSEDYLYCKDYLESKGIKNYTLELYKEALTLFDYYGLETEVLALRNSKIILPSGGNIVIDNTEAMHVIDVNSAKNIKGSQVRDAILNTNMEAAKAIAEQVRLRNIGGIILVDFIDMKEAEDREKVLKLLKEGFKEDKNNPTVYPFTELNLVQISRKRYGKSIYDYILEPCDTCKGKGNKIRLSYLSNIIRSKISRIKAEQNVRDILIELDSIYEKEIKENILSFVTSIEGLDRNVYINFIPHLESFKVEPLLFSNQIRNLEKLRVFQWDEVSII